LQRHPYYNFYLYLAEFEESDHDHKFVGGTGTSIFYFILVCK
jgi:hypothetical protein